MNAQETIGARIARARRKRGLSREELALACDVSYSFQAKVEQGKEDGSRDYHVAVKRALGVSIDYILTGEQSGPRPSKGARRKAQRR